MHRHTAAYALAALASGLALYILGRAIGGPPVAAVGMALAVAALPAVILARQRAATDRAEAQIAAADRAGYLRALDHVSRGLLDTPPTTPAGHPNEPADHGATVHQLYPVDLTERRAQAQ